MYLKIMSGENAADSDSRKAFKLLDHVESAGFCRETPEGCIVEVLFTNGDHEQFPVPSNAYLMNDSGDTIAHFGSAPLPAAA